MNPPPFSPTKRIITFIDILSDNNKEEEEAPKDLIIN
jgi:hypothetical protein